MKTPRPPALFPGTARVLFTAASLLMLPHQPALSAENEIMRGVCFSPFRVGQSPDCAAPPSLQDIREELEFIKKSGISRRLRTYSSAGTQASVAEVCAELGLECWPGAWLSRYPGPTKREIEALIAIGQKKLPSAPVLIVGNEVLLRKDMTEEELILAIRRVKEETGCKVAYAEIGALWLQHKAVADAVDVILVHLYPYWEGRSIDESAGVLTEQWKNLVSEFPGKRVVIGETGWPSAGEQQGAAVPNEANQARYLKDFLASASANNIDYFYFSLFSESWKQKQEGVRGANWGMFTADGALKPGLAGILKGAGAGGMLRVPFARPSPVPLTLPAFIYQEGGSEANCFQPTNWFGSVSSLKIDEYCSLQPRSGDECIQVHFTPGKPSDFSGVYWVGPYMNHWGEYPGYSVHQATKLVFWARGERGGETVEFKMGGLHSPGETYADSFGPLKSTPPKIRLGKEWSRYSISVEDVKLTSLIGAFTFVVSSKDNPSGCTFYLDDIVLVNKSEPPPLEKHAEKIPSQNEALTTVKEEIIAAQAKHVRLSFGTAAFECFTDADYLDFKTKQVTEGAAKDFAAKPRVQQATSAFQKSSANHLKELLAPLRRSLHKTWGELGKISSEGQTGAGKKAELDIANALVDTFETLCRKAPK